MRASPVGHPPSVRHSSSSFGPAASWIAPSTPPPPNRLLLAALTITSTCSSVMSPLMISIRSGTLRLYPRPSDRAEGEQVDLLVHRPVLRLRREPLVESFHAGGKVRVADRLQVGMRPHRRLVAVAPLVVGDALADRLELLQREAGGAYLARQPAARREPPPVERQCTWEEPLVEVRLQR